MTDDNLHREEQVALYALGALETEEAEAFEQRLQAASAVERGKIHALEAVAGELAFSAPLMQPLESLKEQLMARIQRESQCRPKLTDFLFVRGDEGYWQEVSPGVSIKVLFAHPAEARVTALMRMAPGTNYGAHRHAEAEELYILEGSCICAGAFLKAGDYHRAEPGTVHPVTSTEQGCLALVISSTRNEPVD